MANYLTFQNIYQSICKAIADSQYSRADEVKSVANMVYLNEICQCDSLYPLFWLLQCEDSKKAHARATITAITAANPPVITAANHGFSSGDLVTFYDVGGMVELNNRTFRVVKDNANSFHLHDLEDANIDGSSFTAWTSGGYAHHRGLLITSCARVLEASWHGYIKSLEFIGYEQLERETSWWDRSTSRPQKILHRKVFTSAGAEYDYLLWFQAADAAYDLRAWSEKTPARMSADGDVPLLPPQFHDAIISGAITRLGESKVQVEAGVIWPAVYKAQIDAIKAFNRNYWKTQKTYERQGLFLA